MQKKNRSARPGIPVSAGSGQSIAHDVDAGRVTKVVGPDSGDKKGHSDDRLQRAKAREIVEAVMRGATDNGLTRNKNGRIAGRVSSELIAEAKARTGLQSDTELVAFALATVALQDDFAETFRNTKGTVDPDLDLAF